MRQCSWPLYSQCSYCYTAPAEGRSFTWLKHLHDVSPILWDAPVSGSAHEAVCFLHAPTETFHHLQIPSAQHLGWDAMFKIS